MRVGAVLFGLLSAGCLLDAYECRSSSQCVLAGGAAGVCEPSGYCSFADPGCATGRRYGRWASPELAELCVGAEPAADAAEPDLTMPDVDLRGAPDMSAPPPDQSVLPDLPDLRMPDLRMPDFAQQPDMAGGCPVGAVVCDDFETGNISKWPDSTFQAPGAFTVDTVRPRQGAYSLHLTAPANGGSSLHALVRKPYSKAPPMLLSVRLWIYAQVPLGHYGLFVSVNKAGGKNINVGVRDTNQIAVTQDNATVPDEISATLLPVGSWQCVELLLEYPNASTVGARARVFLGQTAALDFVPVSLLEAGDLQVGAVRFPGDNASNYFIDDVTAAYERVPCP